MHLLDRTRDHELRAVLAELAASGTCCFHIDHPCPPAAPCTADLAVFELRASSLHATSCPGPCVPADVAPCLWAWTHRGSATFLHRRGYELLRAVLALTETRSHLALALRTRRLPVSGTLTSRSSARRLMTYLDPAHAAVLGPLFEECWDATPLWLRRAELHEAASWMGIRAALWRPQILPPRAWLWMDAPHRDSPILERLLDDPELVPDICPVTCRFRGRDLLVLAGPTRLLAALARSRARLTSSTPPLGFGPDPASLFPRGQPSPRAELALSLWLDVSGPSGILAAGRRVRLDAFRERLLRAPDLLLEPGRCPPGEVTSLDELLLLADAALTS